MNLLQMTECEVGCPDCCAAMHCLPLQKLHAMLESENLQGCQSSAFRRNSAFYFYFPLFSKLFSSFFEKSHQKKKKKKIITDTATIASVRITSVNSQWRLVLPVCAFFRFRLKFESAVSPLSGRSHAACWRIAWADGGRSGSDRKSFALRTPAFAHPPFPHSSHTHTHTLSLSHTHITDIQGCQPPRFRRRGQSSHATLVPKILQSQKNRPDFIFSPRDSITPTPLSLSLSKQRPAAKSESNFDLY